MRTLTPAERRALRAKAHHLHPFVIVGQQRLTPAVLHEIDVNLRAHELIKLRVSGGDRVERQALLMRICTELDAAPVQHLGKVLTIWRPTPEPEAVAPKSHGKARRRAADPGPSNALERDTQRSAPIRKRPPRLPKPEAAPFGPSASPDRGVVAATTAARGARSQRGAPVGRSGDT